MCQMHWRKLFEALPMGDTVESSNADVRTTAHHDEETGMLQMANPTKIIPFSRRNKKYILYRPYCF